MAKKSKQVATTANPTPTDITKFLGTKGMQRLQEIWLGHFHKGTKFNGGNTEQWFTSVIDFLSTRGDEIIPVYLREREEKVLELGKSQEYMAALSEVVNSEGARTEYDKAVLVLTATAEERVAALEKVFRP